MNSIVWLIVMVVFIVVECFTYQLMSIWMAVGALAAVIANKLGADLTVQIVVFVVTSVVLIACTRPFFSKVVKTKKEKTNADNIIGKTAVVQNTIDNLKNAGTVKISGMEWTARAEDNSVIEAGEAVEILRIEGVKVIVRKK